MKIIKNISSSQIEYHKKQFVCPYESTIAGFNWLSKFINLESNTVVADFGCGSGANLFYGIKKYHFNKCYGIDLNTDLFDIGRSMMKDNNDMASIRFIEGDITDFTIENQIDGIMCWQTLLMLDEWEKFFENIVQNDPEWLFISSLFYDGNIEVKNKIIDSELNQEYSFNIFSLKKIKSYLKDRGYSYFQSVPFNIKKDLPKPPIPRMQTFTRTLIKGEKIQFSGPLYLPWHFIFAKKGF